MAEKLAATVKWKEEEDLMVQKGVAMWTRLDDMSEQGYDCPRMLIGGF